MITSPFLFMTPIASTDPCQPSSSCLRFPLPQHVPHIGTHIQSIYLVERIPIHDIPCFAIRHQASVLHQQETIRQTGCEPDVVKHPDDAPAIGFRPMDEMID